MWTYLQGWTLIKGKLVEDGKIVLTLTQVWNHRPGPPPSDLRTNISVWLKKLSHFFQMEDLLQERKMKLGRALSENENVDPLVEELRGMYWQMSLLDSCDSYTPFFYRLTNDSYEGRTNFTNFAFFLFESSSRLGQTSNFSWDEPTVSYTVHEKFDVLLS